MAEKKRRRNINTIGQELINQIEHLEQTGSRAVTGDVLAAGKVVTTDVSAAGVLVGKGSILRIQAAADTYIAFSDSASIGAVSVTTTPGFKHPGGYVLLCATGDFIRASAAFTRMEVLVDSTLVR